MGGVQRDARAALRNITGFPIESGERGAFDRVREQLLASLDGDPGVVRVALR